MRGASAIIVVLLAGLAGQSLAAGYIARGGGFDLGPEDLRFEVYKLGPTYNFDGTYQARRALVDHLAARFFLAESAEARGYGEEDLAATVRAAEATAVGEAYRKWKIEKSVRVPRSESKQVIDKLDRKIHVKQLTFAVYPIAQEALAELDGGKPFDSVAAGLAGRDDVRFEDHGVKIWRDFDRGLATALFDLEVGEVSRIIKSKAGYSIYCLVGDEPWDTDQELIYLRSKRFVRWLREADLVEKEKAELSRLHGVTYLEPGLAAAIKAFALSFRGEVPPDSLLGPALVTYRIRGEAVSYPVGYFFSYYWSLPPESQPYLGDYHAIEEFALGALMPELEIAAGYDLGLERTREVVWSVKKAREEALVPRMEDEFRRRVALGPNEVVAYFAEHRSELISPATYRVRRILVDSREAAEGVLAEISAGRNFADVAGERSQDSYSAAKGGDLGSLTAGVIAEYDSVVAGLRPGEVSRPFATNQGFEVIKLEERAESRPFTFEEARTYIENTVTEARANEILSDWVDAAKAGSGYATNDALLATIDLPEQAWKAGVAKEAAAEEGGQEISAPGAAGGDAGKAAPSATDAEKRRAARRKMIKKQG
ncbi:MAG: peptidylprolyl isomerase [bacterium]